MRILIAGSQKAGNVWLKCLLAHAYGLRILDLAETPARPLGLTTLKQWIDEGSFEDGTIFHDHYRYSSVLADIIATLPAQIVTILRDPYDSFVSYYFAIQQRQGRGFRRDIMLEKPLDHPDVLKYLRDGGYRKAMRLAKGWVESGRTDVVRYEDLHQDPIGTLTRLAEHLGKIPSNKLEHAVEACSAENMRTMDFVKSGHVRSAKVGDSRDRLNDEHLAVFRENYASLIQSLGYDVR